MKRIMILLLAAMLTAFVGCKKDKEDEMEQENPDETQQSFTKEGLYLTVVVFNDGVQYVAPLKYLDSKSKSAIQKIEENIRSIGCGQATTLALAIDSALNILKQAELPPNLFNASLVTFTDGLEQGSWAALKDDDPRKNLYGSDAEYFNKMSERIKTETIQSKKLDAYGIGVKGADISNNEKFRQSIEKMSSPAYNGYVLSNFAELQSKFREIADQIIQYSVTTDVTITIPFSPNVKACFTFDRATPLNSVKNIQAKMEYADGKYYLNDIQYTGLQSPSGTSIVGTKVTSTNYSFTFNNLEGEDGVTLNQEELQSIVMYTFDENENIWTKNSEFKPADNSTTHENRQTVAIALVLDMSSSLARDVDKVKEAAIQFIHTLVNDQQTEPEQSEYQ